MRWWSAFDPAEVAGGLRADRRGRLRLRAVLPALGGVPAGAGPRGHRHARTPGVGGRRGGTRRAGARAHAVHRAHERRGLDPGVGVGRHGARRPVPRGVRRARGARRACATGTRTRTSCAPRRGWRARRRRRSPGTVRCGRGTWATRTPTARSRRIGRPRGDGWRRRPARSARPIPRRPSRSASTWRTWRRIGTSARRRPPRCATSSRCTATRSTRRGRTGRPTSCWCRSWRVSRAGWAAGPTCCSRSSDCPPRLAGEPAQPPFVTEDEAARYTGRVLDGLRLAGCTGAMLWCYGDYDPRIWNDPPLDEAVHERSFGLWRADGSAKPAVGVVGGVRGRHVFAASRRRLDRHRRRPVLAAARRRAPAPVRPLQGGADRLGVTTRPSRRDRDILEQLEARGAFRASRCDT